jgi:hypothetical protein
MRDPMTRLFGLLDHYGVAKRSELIGWGISEGLLDVVIGSGRHLVRIREGLYARPGERADAVMAWRAGGKLTCVSALAYHLGVEGPTQMHIEVPANTARLHDPSDPRRLIPANRASASEVGLVVHWTRQPSGGDRRAVEFERARLLASRCYAAVESASASRMV